MRPASGGPAWRALRGSSQMARGPGYPRSRPSHPGGARDRRSPTSSPSFLDELFALQPEIATWVGDHRHDDRWPDTSEAGRAGATGVRRPLDRRRSPALDAATLSPTTASTATSSWASSRRCASTTPSCARTPGTRWSWVYLLGAGLHPLLARDFAPLADRLLVRRRAARGHPRGPRPMPGRVIGQRPGPSGVAAARGRRRQAGRRRRRRSGGDAVADGGGGGADRTSEVAALLPRLRAAADSGVARRSTRSGELATDEVAPSAPATPRWASRCSATSCGTRCATRRSRRRASSPRRGARVRRRPRGDGPDRARALAGVAAGRAGARRRGRAGPRRARRDRGRPPGRRRAGRVLPRGARSGSRRSAASTRVIGLVDEPLDIDWTPEFLRSFGGAMLDSPGPLDQARRRSSRSRPVPDDWPPSSAESYLREMNNRQMSLLTIHEAVPGHYLQMALREPRVVARPAGVPLRPVRRGLGGLRDAGDARRAATATTTPPCG